MAQYCYNCCFLLVSKNNQEMLLLVVCLLFVIVGCLLFVVDCYCWLSLNGNNNTNQHIMPAITITSKITIGFVIVGCSLLLLLVIVGCSVLLLIVHCDVNNNTISLTMTTITSTMTQQQ